MIKEAGVCVGRSGITPGKAVSLMVHSRYIEFFRVLFKTQFPIADAEIGVVFVLNLDIENSAADSGNGRWCFNIEFIVPGCKIIKFIKDGAKSPFCEFN